MIKNKSELDLSKKLKIAILLSSMIFYSGLCIASESKNDITKFTEHLLRQFHDSASADQPFPLELFEQKYSLNCNEARHSTYRICISNISADISIYSELTIIQTINSNRTRDGRHERMVINIPANACLTYFDFTTMLPAGFTIKRETYHSSLKIKSVQPASIHTNNTSTVFDYINYKPGSSYSIYIDINPSSKNKCIATAAIQSYREM